MKASDKKLPGADRIHTWANLIVGFHFPRAWIRKLSEKRRRAIVAYVWSMWMRASDNPVRKVPRPVWCPKRFIWGR